MANIYCYSGAAGTASGADWTNACLTLAAAITASATGDTIWVAHDHNETAAATKSFTFKSSTTLAMSVYCANRAGSVPPVAADLRTTAVVANTSGFDMTMQVTSGNFAYIYGINFQNGSGANAPAMQPFGSNSNGTFCYENCSFNHLATGSGSIWFGGAFTNGGQGTRLLNCAFTFAATSNRMLPGGGSLQMIGGSIALTGSVPTPLVQLWGTERDGLHVLDGVDLSAFGSGKTLIGDIKYTSLWQLANCKLGASVAIATTPTVPNTQRIEVINSDSSTNANRSEIYDYAGNLTTELTIVRTGGASNGTTPISYKVVTNANAKRVIPLRLFDLSVGNALTGSSKTVTVEIVNDGTTLTDADIWMEVEYLGSSAQPLATMISSRGATMLTAGTNLPTSSVTWTTTGLASPVKQYLQVTLTPQMVGIIRVRIYVAKASKTLYVDPKITVA